jgi:hypothetical protein
MDTTRQKIGMVLIIAISVVLLWPAIAQGAISLGGFYSEKLIEGSTANSSLLIGGTNEEVVVAGSSVVSTVGEDSASLDGGVTTAVLRGNLTSLNGFPAAEVWFVWGYAPGTMNVATPHVIVAATGEYTATINGWDPGNKVYFAAVTGTDGVYVGGTDSFVVTGGTGIGYWLLYNILPLLIALVAIITCVRLAGIAWVALMAAMVVAIIAFTLVQAMVRVMFGG